jgi:hypothetical protein
MINIQTDLLSLSPSVLSKMSRSNLERIAIEGTTEQKDSLIAWGAFFFEDLYFMATGQEWEQD